MVPAATAVDTASSEGGHGRGNEKIPALIDAVIQTLGRVDVFDKFSLQALRLTCRAFRDLVDDTGVASSARFALNRLNQHYQIEKDPKAVEALQVWASGGGRWLQRTRALFITGQVPEELVDFVFVAGTSVASSVSKIELVGAGPAAQAILSLPLEALRDLYVSGSTETNRFVSNSVRNLSFTQLRSLTMMDCNSTDAARLAAFFAHLSGLRKLKLIGLKITDTHEAPSILRDSLNRLELLHLHSCAGIEKVGLLGAEGFDLPALRSFSMDSLRSEIQPHPWTENLTMLKLSCMPASPGFVAALHSGSLKELALYLNYNKYDSVPYQVFEWKSLDLPHLTRLEVGLHPGDVMGAVARGTMPLRTVRIPIGYNTIADSVHAFYVAFPYLRDLILVQDRTLQAPTSGAVEALSHEVVPRLERLQWIGNTMSVPLIVQNLLPSGLSGGPVRWPLLRSLDLRIESDGMHEGLTSELLLHALAHAAPHFPFLDSLRLDLCDVITTETFQAFVNVAREVQAWPLLRLVDLYSRGIDQEVVRSMLRELWPHVTMTWAYFADPTWSRAHMRQ